MPQYRPRPARQIKKLRGSFCLAKSAVMVFQTNAVGLAEITEAIRLMPRIAPPRSGARAEFREAKTALQAFVFIRDKAVVEIDAVRDKYSVAHELHKKYPRLPQKAARPAPCVGDPCQPGDIGGYGALRIDQ